MAADCAQSAPASQRITTMRPFHASAVRFGPLETKLLDVLWRQDEPVTVRHIQLISPELAYTTIMTTLDRLYRKGVLLRHKQGRAFTYQPRCSRDELLSELMSGQVAHLLAASRQSTVLLSTLVRAVGSTDVALLDELDSLVRAERLRLKMEQQ